MDPLVLRDNLAEAQAEACNYSGQSGSGAYGSCFSGGSGGGCADNGTATSGSNWGGAGGNSATTHGSTGSGGAEIPMETIFKLVAVAWNMEQ